MLQTIVEQLKLDASLVVKLAIEDNKHIKDLSTIKLCIILCNDDRIQEINNRCHNKSSGPTNLLSFCKSNASSSFLASLVLLVTRKLSCLLHYHVLCKNFVHKFLAIIT